MDILANFVETLKELIFDNGVTHIDIEKATGTSNGNVSMWLNKKVMPTMTSLIRLSNYFNCSIEYLLGRKNETSLSKTVSSIQKRIKELAKEKRKSIYKVAIDLGIDESILYRWARGKVAPGLINLIMLADYFGCSVDYLIGREEID